MRQQGLCYEDVFLHNEKEFNEGPIYEHMLRENMHPYFANIWLWNRQRYFKVDLLSGGFEAPQYLKNESE